MAKIINADGWYLIGVNHDETVQEAVNLLVENGNSAGIEFAYCVKEHVNSADASWNAPTDFKNSDWLRLSAPYDVSMNLTFPSQFVAGAIGVWVKVKVTAAAPAAEEILYKIEYEEEADVWGNNPSHSATPQSLAIISVKTGDGTNKNITAFDFNFDEQALSSDAETNLEQANKFEFDYNLFGWKMYPCYNMNTTINLVSQGIINGFTTDSTKYISCNSSYQIILRVNADSLPTLEIPTFTSDIPGKNYTVGLGS